MNLKKSFVSVLTAGVILSAGTPFNALADAPSFYQYEAGTLHLSQIAQYDSGVGEAGTEILAYDEKTHTAFVTNGAESAFDIVSFNSLETNQFQTISSNKRVYLKEFGIDSVKDITSVASHPTEDLVALSVVSKTKTDPGYIVFLTKKGEYITKVQVGSLPDMVTFTPDGKKVVVANEGEPADDYAVDPEGSISIIDIQDGVTKDKALSHTLLKFTNDLLDERVRVSSKGTVAQQLEPEYVTVSSDSKIAYVSLQENNAIATVDLEKMKIVSVKGLGMKDHSVKGNELDAIENGEFKLEKQPLLGYYMPDAIDLLEVNGKTYILTPNEGDSRDYDGYSEEVSIGDIADKIKLNAENYAGYTQEELDQLVADGLLETLAGTDVTAENGLVNGVYESLHSYGARSFTIFDAANMELVFDSGSDFEKITNEAFPKYFNTDNDEIEMDKRSSAKGPEPESIVTGKVGNQTYAFIGLERISAIMVYDVTNPAKAKFVSMVSSRDFSEDIKGDVAPEGLRFIPAEKSPTGNALLAATHEMSGTVAVYEIARNTEEKLYSFKDVTENHWSYEYVKDLYNKELILGTSKTTFSPDHHITFGQISNILSRAFPEYSSQDLTTLIVAQGIIPAEEIRADKKITREQLATVLVYAYETVTGTKIEPSSFTYTDASLISDYAKVSVQKAHELEIMSGYADDTFHPENLATRAQAAKVISLLMNQVN
ncbi:choice-of-anchor I family protein [Bacillus sp. AK128]